MAVKLSQEQVGFYRNVVSFTKNDLEDIQNTIERELSGVKERITKLNGEKESSRQIYDAICQRLGMENEFAKMEEEQTAEVDAKYGDEIDIDVELDDADLE
ncbi:MAG: hypothetical protein HYV63_22060 [Candidatus Schekmanbacteria bacterium]|nr:hypothetical protein [Candidatus Schekmanbacteria bacterium]